MAYLPDVIQFMVSVAKAVPHGNVQVGRWLDGCQNSGARTPSNSSSRGRHPVDTRL